MHGADLNDRLLAIAADGVTLGVEPVSAGAARRDADATLLRATLAARLPAAPAGLWLAVAPPEDATTLGVLLRQLRAADYDVQGFADRAALLGAWLALPRELVLLDVSRGRTVISVAAPDGEACALRRQVVLPGGEAALLDAWVKLAADIVIRQTRFDPLHDAAGAQALRQAVAGLAARAAVDGQATLELAAMPGGHALTLTRDQLAAAAAPWLQPLGATLQALSAAAEDGVLLVPASLLEIPGLAQAVAGARFAHAHRIDDALVARAASLLPRSAPDAGGAVPYLTRCARPAVPPPPDALSPLAVLDAPPAVMATHVVYRGRAWPITAAGLVIGRDPGLAAGLSLPEGSAGVSRRHCTLRRSGDRTQLVEHSRHGTFLDGQRVRGRALLAAGSVLRVGDPGIELPLVALGGAGAEQD